MDVKTETARREHPPSRFKSTSNWLRGGRNAPNTPLLILAFRFELIREVAA